MSRFVVFPALFAAWFGAIQCGLTVFTYLSYWLTSRLLLSPTQPRLFPLSNWSSPYFLLSCLMGAALGVMFAVLDSRSHPEKQDDETLFRLLPNLLKSGVIAVGITLLYYCAFEIPLSVGFYHILEQPPYQNIVHLLGYIPTLCLMSSLVWSMNKTLHH